MMAALTESLEERRGSRTLDSPRFERSLSLDDSSPRIRISNVQRVEFSGKPFRHRPPPLKLYRRLSTAPLTPPPRTQTMFPVLTRAISGPALSTLSDGESETEALLEPSHPAVPSAQEPEVVGSFWELAREKRLLALSIALTDFNAMCCISVLAPFFTKEVSSFIHIFHELIKK